jgi:hypothetical protein
MRNSQEYSSPPHNTQRNTRIQGSMFSARCKENIHFPEQSSTSPGSFTTMDKNLRAEKITPGL